jgi:hypothetical protein
MEFVGQRQPGAVASDIVQVVHSVYDLHSKHRALHFKPMGLNDDHTSSLVGVVATVTLVAIHEVVAQDAATLALERAQLANDGFSELDDGESFPAHRWHPRI